MSSNDPPPPPNYAPIAQASQAVSQEQLGFAREQLDWAKQQFAENKVTSDKVVDQFMQRQDVNFANADKDRARYESLYQPLENKLVDEANNYATPERTKLAMGEAEAATARNLQAGRVNAMGALEGFGLNPGDLKYGALDLASRIQGGAAIAGAGNIARKQTEDTGRALRSEAINVGRGYPGQVAGITSTGLQAGTGAVNAGNTTAQVGGQTMGTAPQYYGGANAALGTWGNTLNQGYSNALQGWNASNQSSGIGSVLGAGAGLAMAFAADGGMMGEGETPGGSVPAAASPTGGKGTDDVRAALTVGEFVVPKDVVAWMGEKKMHDMIVKSREERSEKKAESGAVPVVRPAATQRPVIASRPGALQIRRAA